MIRIALPMLLMLASVASQDVGSSGVVRGIVLDANGQSVAAARAKASFTGSFDGIVPNALTDSSGRFVIEHLPWGEYYVTAAKEQEGYPDQTNAFYNEPNSYPAVVELDPHHRDQAVTVHLGRRAGTIVGKVVNAKTHEPVEACAELRRKDEPSVALSGMGLIGSSFRRLVPADTPFTLALWQRGYEPWFYRDQDGSDSLRVGEGQEVKLEIQMQPNGEKNRPPSDEELKAMVESAATSGCSTPPPTR